LQGKAEKRDQDEKPDYNHATDQQVAGAAADEDIHVEQVMLDNGIAYAQGDRCNWKDYPKHGNFFQDETTYK